MERVLNFSAGPGELPETVLAEAAEAVRLLPGSGVSILGLSHRTARFTELAAEAERNLRALAGISDDYAVLFLQGGATLQFSMIPMHLARGRTGAPEYVVGGYWSARALDEARAITPLDVVWDGRAGGCRELPPAGGVRHSPGAAYLHYVSNETVEGLQFDHVPGLAEVPRVVDLSSDFLSRPHDVAAHHLLYAHAQKNLGPAGVTVVVVRRDVVDAGPRDLPPMLQYRAHAAMGSAYNTPPVFAIYVTLLVTRWLLQNVGGLAAMERVNRAKAACVYAALDRAPDVYRPHAARAVRSTMNAVFTFADARLDARLVAEAEAAGLHGLAGHRSLGGARASLYNAVTLRAAETLAAFLGDFARRHG